MLANADALIEISTGFQTMNAAYRPYFPSPPARATVKAGLPGADNLLAIAMVAVKDAGRTAITTPNADGSPGTVNPNLSSAIRVGNRLYLSGILGNTAMNKGAVKAQTTEVLARVARTSRTTSRRATPSGPGSWPPMRRSRSCSLRFGKPEGQQTRHSVITPVSDLAGPLLGSMPFR